MKKDIWANLYQKCFILCCKLLLNVLYNLGLTILFPWQHSGFQTSPILRVFLATPFVQFSYLQMVPDIPTRSNKHINMLAWVCGLVLHFSSWKSLTYWNQVGGDWKRVSCHGNKMFYSLSCVFYRTISLPSFNDLRCKLAKIALFTQMM